MTYLDIYNINGGDGEKKPFYKNPFVIVLTAIAILLIVLMALDIIPVSQLFTKEEEVIQLPEQNLKVNKPNEIIPPPEIPNPETVNGQISSFINKEPFTNDLPYQLNKQTIQYNDDNDYSEVLKNMALDSGVVSQHNQYVKDRNKITSTASFAPTRSDSQDIVTSWGFTKSQYINIDPSARTVPSQSPEQGSKPITLKWN